MKLTIGKASKKKEKKATIIDSYADDYSDEELDAMSKEANLDPSDFDLTETEEMPEEVKKELEADMKEATNGVIIFDEVGISMKYVYKFTESYPKKNIIYHDFITKQFLEWYIKNAKLTLLKKLFVIESEYVNPEQQEKLSKMIDKRLQKEEIELEDFEDSINDEIDEKTRESREHEKEYGAGLIWELETEDQIKTYELILTEKWNANERAKGIQQLDAIIEEQMRVNEFSLNQALSSIIDKFHLHEKLLNLLLPKEEVIVNPHSNAEVSKELDRSIRRFHHIKFLYELMSEKMEFIETNPPTIEDIEKITVIKELLYDTITPKEKKEVDIPFVSKETMEKFMGGKD